MTALQFALGAAVWLIGQTAAWAFGGSGAKIWLPEGSSSVAPEIDRLFYIVLIITGVVFVLVQGTLIAFLILYRRRPGRKATYIHGSHLVEIIWTVIPAVILVFLTVTSQRVWAVIHGTPPTIDLELEVTAEQFAWNIRYPGPDGKLGSEDDLTTINQMHLPLGKVVMIRLISKDVIHSFFVPQFRVKRDAVPGITSRLWVQATRPGTSDIACAELCGLGHYRMRGFLTVETPEEFQAWLAKTAEEFE
ncbi:MAG TPA: cytochrome c oxidase subunit II [bacterium]